MLPLQIYYSIFPREVDYSTVSSPERWLEMAKPNQSFHAPVRAAFLWVLTNGIGCSCRNAMSVIEAPTGHEEDDDLEYENVHWNGSNLGELDVALDLVERDPVLGRWTLPNGISDLNAVAGKASAFPSGRDLNIYERFIYSWAPVSLRTPSKTPFMFEMTLRIRLTTLKCLRMCGSIPLFAQDFFHYEIKEIQHTKLMHHQALCLIEILCEEIRSLIDSEAYSSYHGASS